VGAGRAPQKGSGELILEADEVWSFVGSRREVWWIWVTLDAVTRRGFEDLPGGHHRGNPARGM
jgi:hypothetical protein